jgi:predicted phage baseplate assembly protein
VEFDFLPKLPSSNLDDRAFDDLVEECILRIPRYCQEWTDHNLSDPGITLIELFAWLTDQMLLRFNQVPRKNYVAFLELLGVRLQPPTPAQTDLTFYLTTDLPEVYTIAAGVEVASLRSETTTAITFSTDAVLTIGVPNLQHFLTAPTIEEIPQVFQERGANLWSRQPNGFLGGGERAIFAEQPEAGNCFYLVLNSPDTLDGNVLALTFKGGSATPTGINPDRPPRTWEAWDGEVWRSILLRETDDGTKGFSFYEIAQQGGNPSQGADVILHLPEKFPVTSFTSYRGMWLRCSFTLSQLNQTGYNRPPRITGLAVRSIGGTVRASHSSLIEEERLGISDASSAQTFQLQTPPILERRENEYILVTPVGGLPQRWQEVTDFADSGPEDRHYTIDSLSGIVQFGPLIREPNQLQRQTKIRAKIQQPQPEDTIVQVNNLDRQSLEHQYGAVPPRGAEIRILGYRTGGGRQGNVQAHTLQFLKSAIPYVASVDNHPAASNGADGESLDQAVLRVPQMLRTRDRAVTAEDFEVLARIGGAGGVARVKCLPMTATSQAGTVNLVVVPQANTDGIIEGVGIAPELFELTSRLRQKILHYLDERRLLGVQVQLREPEYVGVSVQTEIALEPAYQNPFAEAEITNQLKTALYQFLNPLTGGFDRQGWDFGRPLYTSDIIALAQKIRGVRYLGAVLLFPIRKVENIWRRQPAPENAIDPGINGAICSWADDRLRSSHVINIITR